MPLRIALAQIDTCVGDLDQNAARVLEWCARAAEARADVVVLPEMTVTGYPIEDLALRDSFARAADATVRSIAADLLSAGLGELVVVLGTLGRSPAGRATNRAVTIHRGRVVASYDKHHLPNYGVFDEFRIFSAGASTCVIDVAGRRVGVVICEDIWQDGGPVSQMDAADVDVLLVLNGSPYEEGKGHARVELAARRAREVGRSRRLRQPRRRPGRPRLRRRLVRGGAGRHRPGQRPAVRRAPARLGPARRGPGAGPRRARPAARGRRRGVRGPA